MRVFNEGWRGAPANADLDPLEREWRASGGESSERVAWYVYDWANSVYSSVCISLVILLFLTTMAQRQAQTEIASCPATCSVEGGCVTDNGSPAPSGCQACVVGIGTRLWDGAQLTEMPVSTVDFFGPVEHFTFATRVVSVSVGVQAIMFITFGAVADYGSWRKAGLVAASVLGFVATVSFVFLGDPQQYLAAAWLAIISNSCFGVAIVYYNAYLPLLVDLHPEVEQSIGGLHETAVRDEISNFMSSVGLASGFLSAFVFQIFAAGLLVAVPSNADNQNLGHRLVICLGAVWWGVWSVWTFLRLKPHPAKALPPGEWLLTKGWTSTAAKLGQAASFSETLKLLVAYFLYSDSYSTIASLGVLVMQQQICMTLLPLFVISTLVLVCALAGNFLSLRIQQYFKLQPKYMIFGCLCVYALICVVGILGLIPGSPLGLKSEPEAYIFGALHGLMLGPVQSYSRTLYSDLVIPGKEAEFFALYEISDKGSSWLGPLVIGEIFRATRNINAGFVYLIVMTIFPALLLLTVDHRKVMAEVRKLASQEGAHAPTAQELQVQMGAPRDTSNPPAGEVHNVVELSSPAIGPGVQKMQ